MKMEMQYYDQFHTKKGMLLVTTDGKKNNGKVTHISMMYNDANGPTYQAVKNYVGKAVTHTEYSKVAGNFGYIEKGKTTYQFASAPKDKNIKLYRIDLEIIIKLIVLNRQVNRNTCRLFYYMA